MTAQDEDVIDLTNSFTLVDHQNMKGVIIDVESDTQTEHSTSTHRQRKRQAKSREVPRFTQLTIPEHSTSTHRQRKRQVKSREVPRPTQSTSPSICDLRTPENKVKKSAVNSTIAQERERSTPTNKSHNNGTDLKHCCPICYDVFGTNPLGSTKCGHVFCFKCITLALKNSPNCPTCRRKLKGASAVHPIFL